MDCGQLPGVVAHDALRELQRAMLSLDLFCIIDPLELKRLVLALQHHHVSGRMSTRRAAQPRAPNRLSTTTQADHRGTGDNRTVSGEGHGDSAYEGLMPGGSEARTVECVAVHAKAMENAVGSCDKGAKSVNGEQHTAVDEEIAANEADEFRVVIPETLTEEKVEAYSASRKLAKRNDERSHKFAAESYVQTASIETSSCTDSDSTLIRVRALCYRSQKKTSPAYKVSAAFSRDGNIHDCTCECAAREKCGDDHDGDRISACGVDELDWRAPRPGGLERPTPSRLYEARKKPRLAHEVQLAALKFGEALETHAPSPFARHLRNMMAVPATSTFGETCVGSLLWCQKPVLPHHFTTYLSPDIQLGVRAHPNHPTPPEPDLFTSTTMFAPSSVSLPDKQRAIFETLIPSIQDARLLEKSSLAAEQEYRVEEGPKVPPDRLQLWDCCCP
ncbi:hypothetical protein MTO96_051987 [Rhipicephalus appendiculatus]